MFSNHGRPEPSADRTPHSVLAERRREARHGARHPDVLRDPHPGHHLRRLRADRGPLIDSDRDVEFGECDRGGGNYRSAVCGLVIVFVINFIVSLMAVIRMHHGADEYGPEHAVNARRGVLFKWIGTTLSTLAAILVVYLVLAGSSLLFGGPAPAILYVP